MQQNIAQEKGNQSVATDDSAPIQINVRLDGSEAARFLHYQRTMKLKRKADAGYRLMIERLEQVEKEAA